MADTIRVIVVNADEEAAPELRAHLLNSEGVKIVAEVDEPAMLAHALGQFPCEVLLIHLDPNPAGMMDAVVPILEARKDRPAAICMTEDRDAELVVRAMRAGMKEFLWKPFPPEQLNEILRRVGTEAPPALGRQGLLVPVIGASGGVGATTLATNVAVELAQIDPKARVAVVDLDFRFGQVAMFLDSQPTYTIAELCETAEQLDDQMIQKAMFKHSTGIHILAHPPDPAAAERISAGQTAGVLAALQEHYDFVVVDGPVRFDATARAVYDMTDIYLVVMQLVVPCVRNTERLLHDMARNGYSLDRVRLVCNRHNREHGCLEPTDVENTLGRKIDFMIPEDWKTSSTAVNMGAALADYAPKSKLRAAYQKIAQGIVRRREGAGEEGAAAVGEPAKKGRLFGFLAGQKG